LDRERAGVTSPVDSAVAAEVTVWDRPLRIVHWALVICVAIAWVTPNVLDTTHNVAGYCVLGLLLFRVVWGFAGPRYARFSHAIASPRTVWRYARALASGNARRHLGHNPAGAAMMVAMLLALLVTGVTGHIQITVQFFGVAWVQDLHTYAADAVLVLVALHVLGVVFTGMRNRENLVRSMLTGRKERRPGDA
jgi:cytochrome b